MLMFLRHLLEKLNEEEPDWKQKICILLDGARYHTSEAMRDYLRVMGICTFYSAPYSYDSAPIELLFGNLKLGELNKAGESTGKK